jgi:3-hydroxy-5-methyl-1-naphthoate 3-O-methyltransferase
LDVGGGSGVFASTFVSKNAGTTAVVFDLPNVIPITKEFIDKEHIQNKVSTLTGNYLIDDIGSGYDLVFLCAIIHSNSDSENRLLIKKCYESLNSGGQIVIVDFVMNNDRTEPAGGTIFAINMLVGTEKGDTYTKGEIFSWLNDASFIDLEVKNTPDEDSIVYGRKK